MSLAESEPQPVPRELHPAEILMARFVVLKRSIQDEEEPPTVLPSSIITADPEWRALHSTFDAQLPENDEV
jgi:hypothetical protein